MRATARRAGRRVVVNVTLRDHAAAERAGRGADPGRLREGPELSFATPLLLLGLLLLPLVVLGHRWLQRRPTKYAVRYTNLDVLAGVVESTRSWRRHAGLALFLLALAALLVGFARPSVNRLADREEATIVLVIDVSGSMQAEDVEPTRLAAAQKVVREFLKGLPKRFRVGVVSFSETAEVAAPATEDRQLAIDAIDYLYAQRGTAIGDGLARGVEVAREAEIGPDGPVDRNGSGDGGGAATGRDPPALRRLADGGMLLPLEGAARAKSFKIPVYTIALGTPEGVVEFNRFGGTRIIPVPPDRADAAADRRDHRRPVLQGRERRRAARGLREHGVAGEQGRAQAGGDVRVPRGRTRADARRGGGRRRHVPETSVRALALALVALLLAGCSGGDDEPHRRRRRRRW